LLSTTRGLSTAVPLPEVGGKHSSRSGWDIVGIAMEDRIAVCLGEPRIARAMAPVRTPPLDTKRRRGSRSPARLTAAGVVSPIVADDDGLPVRHGLGDEAGKSMRGDGRRRDRRE
jgi:hypothetical protein